MLLLDIKEIIRSIDGDMIVDGGNYLYTSICTDTRKMERDSIFVALKGDNFNGNEFLLSAIEKGALICIIDEMLFSKEDIKKGVTIIKVKNCKEALMKFAKYYRSKLDIKVIGVTGSTGKTSTKDLIAAVLSGKYKVFKTKGNFNNEIGLPLMIFKLDNSYDIAVLEMGMSDLGEIHNLADVARPDIGVITNIGISHIENLKTRENILKAKLEIKDFFNESNTLIVNGDNDLLKPLEKDNFNFIKIGTNEEFDYCALNIILKEDSSEFTIKEKESKENIIFNVPMPGNHNVLNSLLALACGRLLGLEYEDIQRGVYSLEATSRRLDVIKKENYIIVDDCYNASPDSMKAAIDVVSMINGKRRIAVLGTMKELGDNSYQFHKEVGSYALEKGIDVLITIGEYNTAYKEGFGAEGDFFSFDSCDEASTYLKTYIKKDDIILIKASRSMKFEAIVEKLK